MALVNLQTDLTSLPFGHDRPGGGSSNQPYITSDIPENAPVQSPDFLLRNGFLAPVSAVKDSSRLTQMFFDTKSPRGLLFIAKENLLSRISVKTQASIGMAYAVGALNQGVYLPTSTIAQSLVGFTGTHLNLLGIDPSSPMAGAGQEGLLEAIGLPSLGLKPYEKVIKNQDFPLLGGVLVQNRLIELTKTKINPTSLSQGGFSFNNIVNSAKNAVIGGIFGQNNVSQNPIEILAYGGGPGSIVGIGKTRIRFASGQRTGINNFTWDKRTNSIEVSSNKINAIGSNQTFEDFRISETGINTLTKAAEIKGKKISSITGLAPSYKPKDKKTIDGPSTSRINYVSPGQRGNVINYTEGKRTSQGAKMGPVDRINALPIYSWTTAGGANSTFLINDLVKFRIAAINDQQPAEKDYIHFRAYIDAFSDAYNGSWDAINYMGRGESFYKYNNFKRTINLAFTVAAQSKEELIPMYKKLNFLASNLAPSYSDSGYMAGSLVELTLGGWCYNLPGFISSMNLDVPEESPWEIGINTDGGFDSKVKELPHIVKVTGFSFTPIERFRPSKQVNKYVDPDENLTDNNTYGPERYIALEAGSGTNYDKPEVKTINMSTTIASEPIIRDAEGNIIQSQ